MGHAKEIITMDVYGDNQQIIEDCVPEIQGFLDEVLPTEEDRIIEKEELLDIMPDVDGYLPPGANDRGGESNKK